MKNFIKQNKVYSILLVVILIMVIIDSVIFLNLKNKEDQDDTIKIDMIDDLPDITEINFNDNPMLYDFVNSSLGFKFDKFNENVEEYGFFYSILQDKNKDLYISYYDHGENLTFPSLGSSPIKLELDKTEQKYIDSFSSKLSKNRVFEENDYKLFIVSRYNNGDKNNFNFCDNAGRWAGFELNKIVKNKTDGLMHQTIYSGAGWPSEWLVKYPYNETIKIEGYDITQDFWKRYNIRSKLTFRKIGEELKLIVEVVQLDRFKIKVDGQETYVNEDELKMFLDLEGWE